MYHHPTKRHRVRNPIRLICITKSGAETGGTSELCCSLSNRSGQVDILKVFIKNLCTFTAKFITRVHPKSALLPKTLKLNNHRA